MKVLRALLALGLITLVAVTAWSNMTIRRDVGAVDATIDELVAERRDVTMRIGELNREVSATADELRAVTDSVQAGMIGQSLQEGRSIGKLLTNEEARLRHVRKKIDEQRARREELLDRIKRRNLGFGLAFVFFLGGLLSTLIARRSG